MPPKNQQDDTTPETALAEGEKRPQSDIPVATNPLEEILPEGTPIEVRHIIRVMGMMMFGPSRSGDPLLDKLSDKSIDKYLENIDRDSQREHDRKKLEPLFRLLYVLIGVVAVCWVIAYLAPINPALLSDILKILVAAILGFGGGFGYKSYLDQRDQ